MVDLGVYGISDVNPARVHLMVRKTSRFRRRTPKWIVIHRGNFAASEVTTHEGLPVTSVVKSVLDMTKTPAGWGWRAKRSAMRVRKATLRQRN